MIKSKFATGYLKWDGKKYILEDTLINNSNVIAVNIEEKHFLYFSNGSCQVVKK
jgi:hypothetical protein